MIDMVVGIWCGIRGKDSFGVFVWYI